MLTNQTYLDWGMEYLNFLASRPKRARKAIVEFFKKKGLNPPKLEHLSDYDVYGALKPYPLYIPQSGMDRAIWWEKHMPKFRIDDKVVYDSIGAIERMAQGTSRDDAFGALILRNHNWYDLPTPTSLQADNVAKIWALQTAASNGLDDEDGKVYVSQDAVSIWAHDK